RRCRRPSPSSVPPTRPGLAPRAARRTTGRSAARGCAAHPRVGSSGLVRRRWVGVLAFVFREKGGGFCLRELAGTTPQPTRRVARVVAIGSQLEPVEPGGKTLPEARQTVTARGKTVTAGRQTFPARRQTDRDRPRENRDRRPSDHRAQWE